MDLKILQKRIGIQFPNDKLEEILFHSSYPQDSYLLERNKRYISWGSSIIRASYSLYLYLHIDHISAGDLSIKLANEYRSIVDSIFTTYRLEEFVVKSKGEMNQLHTDVVQKLIVLMYQQYGFLSTYDFLCPFFKSKFIEQNIDYKTILQNYAQSKKYSYVYDIIATSGPDHEKKFTCKLTVANMMAIGEGIGKKKAEKEAAKQFIKKYKILQTKKSEKKAKNQSYSISVERKGELNCIINSLRLNSSQISIHQLDEIFTHISYANENKDKGIRDNSSISVVGDKVLIAIKKINSKCRMP